MKAGTMDEGLRSPEWLITVVIALVSSGCPLPAIVRAFGREKRTVTRGIERAGKHGEQVHAERMVQQKLDLHQVQADEIDATCDRKVAWMAMAIMVPTRRWLGGIVNETRDHTLTDRLFRLVRACRLSMAALLVCGEGFAASPGSMSRAFRDTVPHPSGMGRTRLQAWPEILMGIVNTPRHEKRVVQVTREMLQGVWAQASAVFQATKGGGNAQDRLYRAFPCHEARATGLPHPALPPCVSSHRDGDSGHVADGHHLERVHPSSRTQPTGGKDAGKTRRDRAHPNSGSWLDGPSLDAERTALVSTDPCGFAPAQTGTGATQKAGH